MYGNKTFQRAILWPVVTFLVALVLLVYAPKAQAAINQSFTYQGKLLDKSTGEVITSSDAGCIVAGDSNDTCDFRASLYTALADGTLVWQDTELDVEMNSNDGSFELILDCGGTFSNCNQNGGPDFNTDNLYLELEFAPDGASSFTETFTPRKQLSSVPYAFNADTVDGVNISATAATPEGSITGSVGDLALDTTNGNVYLKTSGEDTNTGWTAAGGTLSKLSLTNTVASWDDITTTNSDFTLQSTYSGANDYVDINFAAPANKDLTLALWADGEGGGWSPNLNIIVDRTTGIELEAGGYLNIKTSDTIGTGADSSDYIRFQTTSNVPEILTVGAADLKINAGGSNNLLLNDEGGSVSIGDDTPEGNFDVLLDQNLTETGAVCIDSDNVFSDETDGVCDSSSIRVKTDISDLSYGLDEILNLHPVLFRYKETFKPEFQYFRAGFIAEEMDEIVPEVVTYDRDGLPDGIDYGKLTAVLASGIQEQQVIIENLAEKVEIENVGSSSETYEMLVAMGVNLEGIQGNLLTLTKRVSILEAGWDGNSTTLNLSQFAQFVADGEVLQFIGGVEFLAGVTFHAPVAFSGDQVGALIIPAGATKVKVTFSTPFARPPVVSLTPTQAVQGLYSLEEISNEGFVVSLLIASEIDLNFSWSAFLTEGGGVKVEVVEESANVDAILAEFDELANTEILEDAETSSPSSNPLIQQIRILGSELGVVPIKQEPTTDSEELGQATPGEVYEYFEASEDGWYKIEFFSGEGWVSGGHVEILVIAGQNQVE